MPSELLPCPFCGRSSFDVTDQYDEDGRWMVLCLGCRVGTGFCRERDKAISKWNTRAPNATSVASQTCAECHHDKLTKKSERGICEFWITDTTDRLYGGRPCGCHCVFPARAEHKWAERVGQHNDDPLWGEIRENVEASRAKNEESEK